MRNTVLWAFGLIMAIVFFFAIIIFGPVNIPLGEVMNVIFGRGSASSHVNTIVVQTRLPMAIGAACCGATLSAAGLILQTLFHNPLSGPSVLGISSGSSLGVAFVMLGVGGVAGIISGGWQTALSITGALIGGGIAIAIIYMFSLVVKSGVTLLIAGLMLSYLCSSGIALLNYFSPADEIRNYLVWSLGSFNSLRLDSALWLAILSIAALIPTILYIKPLNALLMGERYIESVGYSIKGIRGGILLICGILVALPTAFCGPIGFIGLVVPHICRLLFRTSNHLLMIPATILFGALTTLICAFLSVVPASHYGILPINVITPIIGVPVILYLLLKRNTIPYFS